MMKIPDSTTSTLAMLIDFKESGFINKLGMFEKEWSSAFLI